MTDEDRPAWVLWQIRALWHAVQELRERPVPTQYVITITAEAEVTRGEDTTSEEKS